MPFPRLAANGCVLLCAVLGLALADGASARDPHGLGSGAHGIHSSQLSRHSGSPSPTRTDRVRAYGEGKRLEARRTIRSQESDLRLRSDVQRLGPRPKPTEVERVRDRAQRRESMDALLNEADLATLERFHGPLGPTTRRVLERSRIQIETLDRSREIDVGSDQKLRELGDQEAAERELFEVSAP